jgi:Male sterility protein
LTSKQKPYTYVSTIGVADQIEPAKFTEDADIRIISPTRKINDRYANGYGNSKWAGEVLLREAHDLCGLPVAVFRCDLIRSAETWLDRTDKMVSCPKSVTAPTAAAGPLSVAKLISTWTKVRAIASRTASARSRAGRVLVSRSTVMAAPPIGHLRGRLPLLCLPTGLRTPSALAWRSRIQRF